MPIHTSWKSMCKSMLANKSYCKRNPKRKCRKFTDGSRLCGCQGGWSVFFATVNKMGADDTKPRPKSKQTSESREKIIQWFIESTLKSSDLPEHVVPKWVGLAKKVLQSPKFNKKIKDYWRGRLKSWCKKYPKYPLCKKLAKGN